MAGHFLSMLAGWTIVIGFLALPVVWVIRMLLIVLVALQLRIIVTRGVGAVSWLGWLIFLLTFLSFRRETPSRFVGGMAAGAAAGVAAGMTADESARYVINTTPNRNARVAANGNRID